MLLWYGKTVRYGQVTMHYRTERILLETIEDWKRYELPGTSWSNWVTGDIDIERSVRGNLKINNCRSYWKLLTIDSQTDSWTLSEKSTKLIMAVEQIALYCLWLDDIQQDMKDLGLIEENARKRWEWRRKIYIADPAPRKSKHAASMRERERERERVSGIVHCRREPINPRRL